VIEFDLVPAPGYVLRPRSAYVTDGAGTKVADIKHVSGNSYKYTITSTDVTKFSGTTPNFLFGFEAQFITTDSLYNIYNNVDDPNGTVEVKESVTGKVIDKFYASDSSAYSKTWVPISEVVSGLGTPGGPYDADHVYIIIKPDEGYTADISTLKIKYVSNDAGIALDADNSLRNLYLFLNEGSASTGIDLPALKRANDDLGGILYVEDGDKIYFLFPALPESDIEIVDLQFKEKLFYTVTADAAIADSVKDISNPKIYFDDEEIDNTNVTFTITSSADKSLKIGSVKLYDTLGAEITTAALTTTDNVNYSFIFPGKSVVIKAEFTDKIPDRNNPAAPAWKEPKGGFLTVWDDVDYGVANINNPITDNFYVLANGGGRENAAGTAVNLNDPTHVSYLLPGGGGVVKDGVLNKNNPDELAFYLKGGKGYKDPSETPEDPTPALLGGDVNSDGEVTLADAQLLLKFLVDLAGPEEINFLNIWAIDNSIGSENVYALNLTRVSQILRIIIGLEI
jgi:hypothetical protein